MTGEAPEMAPAELGDVPPHDIQAERITLGSMMLSATAIGEIIDIPLAAGDHYLPAHQIVHEVILHLHGAGEPTEAEAVLIELGRRGELRAGLDATFLFALIQAVPVALSGPHYAREVARHARVRRAQEGISRALLMTKRAGFSPDEDMDRVRQAVDDATGTRADAGSARWLADAVLETLDKLDKPLPPDEITPPYVDLRDVIPALRDGQLVTVAARPSIGKTVVAGDFARHAAFRLGLPVAWFSLEMSREELIIRTLAAEARVSQDHLQRHTMDDAEWARVEAAAQSFGESRLLIDDKSGSSIAHVRSALRAMARDAVPRLVIFDYLQLGSSPGAPSRQEEVSRLTRDLKDVARDFGLPVLMAAQLNRNPESRHDKRPLQADLRESGEIENSSDVVILLHREDYYERESPRAGEMDLIVTKNRNGVTATVTVAFQGRFCRCVGMAPEDCVRASEWTPTSTLGVVA
jgi:replicative DNA helicase